MPYHHYISEDQTTLDESPSCLRLFKLNKLKQIIFILSKYVNPGRIGELRAASWPGHAVQELQVDLSEARKNETSNYMSAVCSGRSWQTVQAMCM